MRDHPFLTTTAMVGATLALALAIDRALSLANLSLIFMMPVLAAAFLFGLWPGLWAAVLGVLGYNFLFLPPLYTLTIASAENVYALFFLLVAAVIASHMAALMRTQMRAARDRARTTADLYAFSRKLAGLGGYGDVLAGTAEHIARMLGLRVLILLPGPHGLSVGASHPPQELVDDADLAAAQWSWDHRVPAGRGAETLPGARRRFVPMRTERAMVGILGIGGEDGGDAGGRILSPEEARLLDALADQAAVAIERVTLARDIDRARLLTETERLRSALLTSISHDLRTPLASIVAAATTLRAAWVEDDPAVRDELVTTVVDEAERLNRFVNNLLDMTRLESGAVVPNLERIDLADVIGTALRRVERVLGDRRIRLDLPPDLPMVALDFVLFEQVLVNLLDNAAKYSPDASPILITAGRRDEHVFVAVEDEGGGLPPDQLERVFDKFHRVAQGDRQRAGTGLGLAVCRGFVEALGGTITAANRPEGIGARFLVELPINVTSTQEIESSALQ